ncbi:hypothetical protein SGRIM128S_07008 [Streptomyces griseomycini]
MARLAARRALLAVPVLLVVTFGAFALAAASPFDPVKAYAGTAALGADQETLDRLRENLGVDRPFTERWWDWLTSAVSGDLGQSSVMRQPVAEVIGERLVWSALLCAVAFAVAVLLGTGGRRIGLVPQSPAAHLTPVRTIRSQLEETVAQLTGVRGRAALRAAAERAAERAAFPADHLDRHPHELSGGLAQRAATALALVGEAPLLLADEPTTGLDRDLVDRTVDELRRHVDADGGRALLMITHDLAAAERIADRIAVMYAGRIVELADAGTFFGAPGPRHPYSRGLLDALPDRAFTPIPGMPPAYSAPSPTAAPSPPAAAADRHLCDPPGPDRIGRLPPPGPGRPGPRDGGHPCLNCAPSPPGTTGAPPSSGTPPSPSPPVRPSDCSAPSGPRQVHPRPRRRPAAPPRRRHPPPRRHARTPLAPPRPARAAHRIRRRLPAAPALRGPPAAPGRPDRRAPARHRPARGDPRPGPRELPTPSA